MSPVASSEKDGSASPATSLGLGFSVQGEFGAACMLGKQKCALLFGSFCTVPGWC